MALARKLSIVRKDGRLVALIEMQDGIPRLLFASERVREDVESWLAHGLVVRILPADPKIRVLPTDQNFLEQVAIYVRRLGMDAILK